MPRFQRQQEQLPGQPQVVDAFLERGHEGDPAGHLGGHQHQVQPRIRRVHHQERELPGGAD